MPKPCQRRCCQDQHSRCCRRACASKHCRKPQREPEPEYDQFQFGDLIALSPESIVFAKKFVETSGLCDVGISTAYGYFAPQTEDGFLSVTSFQRVLSDPSQLHQSEDSLSNLQALFNLFDGAQTGYAKFDELFACLAVLLKGSKSDKLQFLFDLFDENRDDKITVFAFRRFVHALLLFFHWLQPMNSADMESYCRSVTDSVFSDAVGGNLNLSFESFGTWYNAQGNHLIPWIELLDTGKWSVHRFSEVAPKSDDRSCQCGDPSHLDFAPEEEEKEEEEEEEEEEKEEEGEEEASPSTSCEYIVNELQVTEKGASIYNYIQESTHLGKITAERLLLILLMNSKGGLISFEDYTAIVTQFYIEESQLLHQIFTQLFQLFDAGRKGQADVLEISGSLIAFCQGTKSEKLLAVFHCFDKDNSNSLSYHRLNVFLEAFLRTLNYLTRSSLDEMIHASILHILSEFASFTGLQSSQNFDLDIFGDWYNRTGNQLCPWIELLNPNKWPMPESSEDLPTPAPVPTVSKAAPPSPHDPTDPLLIYYQFPLEPTDQQLCLRAKDCWEMHHIISVLPWKDFSTVQSWGHNGVVPLEQFQTYLKYGQDHEVFLRLYKHMSVGLKGGSLPVRSLITALSLFYPMSKTDKLNVCFGLFTPTGKVSVELLEQFLFNILWAIHFVQGAATMFLPIRNHVKFLAKRVAKKCNSSQSISFSQFAEWYNQEGFNYATWLELLDHDKWPSATLESEKAEVSRPPKTTAAAPAPAPAPAAASATERGKVLSRPLLNYWDMSFYSSNDSPSLGYAPGQTNLPLLGSSKSSSSSSTFSSSSSDSSDSGSSGAPISESSRLVFSFTLNSTGTRFSLYGSDVKRLQTIVACSNFFECTAKELQEQILSLTLNPILTFEQFMSFVDSLFLQYPATVRPHLIGFFENFFKAFDSNGNRVVNKNSIAIGITLFAGGEKSSKLASAFELMAPNQDGYLSRASCRIYFLSFLIPLFALSDQFSHDSEDQIFNSAETTVSEILDSLFHRPQSIPQCVTYAEFAKWYSAKGMNQIQWIELYALSKWPFSHPFPPPLPTAVTAAPPAAVAEPVVPKQAATESSDGVAGDLPIQIDITTSKECPEEIIISPRDISAISSLVQECALLDHSIESIIEAIESVSKSQSLSLCQFECALRELIDPNLSPESISAFRSLYNYLDMNHQGSVPKTTLQIAMIVFTGEKKSPKLTAGYSLLAASISSYITPSQMTRFLSALMAPIVFMLEMKPSFRTILNYCSMIVDRIFSELDLYTSISFDDFSKWYMEKNGCQIITWLELLDWFKWILSPPQNVFVFPIGNDPVHLKIDQRMTQKYDQFISVTGLGEKTPHFLTDFILHYNHRSTLSRREYNSLIRELVPFQDMDKYQSKEVSHFFNRLFDVQSNGRDIPKATLISSMMVFVQGKKSEKLLFAFKSYNDGTMGFFSLCNFLFALLFPILVLKRDPSEEDITKITEECKAISSLIFDDASLSKKAGTLSFEQFCEWYSETGHQYTNWLELLDGSKWPFY